jgi:DNA-binding IclR family transcriptional regulator
VQVVNEDDAIQSDSGGVQSVEVGVDVLRPLLAAGRPVPLKMITAATGLPRAKVHRYLVSLVRSGLVSQEPQTGYYGLGSLALQLGLVALGSLDRDGLGRQAIRELRDALNVTACLCVWSDGPRVIAVEPAEADIFVGLRTGSRLSMLRSATGHVFLAYLPAKTTREHASSDGSTSSAKIGQIQESVRKLGIAGVKDLVMVGMSGFAAPVFDHTGSITATLTLAGPTGSFDASMKGPVANTLLQRAQELSARLGYLEPKRARG